MEADGDKRGHGEHMERVDYPVLTIQVHLQKQNLNTQNYTHHSLHDREECRKYV